MMDKTTAAAGAAGIPVGVVVGLAYDTLIAGFAGGAIGLAFTQPAPWYRMGTVLAASTFLAAFTAPVAAAGATAYFPWVAGVGDQPLRMAVACCIGVLSQTVVPAAMAWIRRFAGMAESHGGGQ